MEPSKHFGPDDWAKLTQSQARLSIQVLETETRAANVAATNY
jgi:hypothetical protein